MRIEEKSTQPHHGITDGSFVERVRTKLTNERDGLRKNFWRELLHVRVESPNAPKLSHTPERRGLCGRRRSRVGRRAVGVVKGSVVDWREAVGAQAVTRRRVGCSALLGAGVVAAAVG
jgi:hypothetical protein